MELVDVILNIIKVNIGGNTSEITIDTLLNNDNGISSFDKLMIINAIEDHFSITLEESQFVAVKSIRDLVDIVNQQIVKKG